MNYTLQQLRDRGFKEVSDGVMIKQIAGKLGEEGNLCEVAVTKSPPKRIRQDTKPKLNKLELEYQNMLAVLYFENCTITSQAIRFNLANGLWYKPDFVVFNEGILAIEVKGPHAFRGGFENLKMAARAYPFIRWRLAWKKDGQWQEQTVLP